MEYLIFTVYPLGIELGLVAIVAGVVFFVMRNIKQEKAHHNNKGADKD